MVSEKHHYARVGDGKIVCACGHAEPMDEATFNDALERMNAHIRSCYTDEEWALEMEKFKVGLIDKTGVLTMPSKDPRS